MWFLFIIQINVNGRTNLVNIYNFVEQTGTLVLKKKQKTQNDTLRAIIAIAHN